MFSESGRNSPEKPVEITQKIATRRKAPQHSFVVPNVGHYYALIT